MRASKNAKGKEQGAKRKKSKPEEIHISGAEGLYEFAGIEKVAKEYFLRAMSHPKGKPDKVVITVEKVKGKPVAVPLLSVSTIRCDSPDDARSVIKKILSDTGISGQAIKNGIRVVTGRAATHGAAMMGSESAVRVEPDRKRGIRVSRLGIRKDAGRHLSSMLSKEGINTATVKEAIILASKVASCRGVVAELCVSDDPDYTTGYVASRDLGYVRIPHIKKKGSLSGGRVFFVDEKADVKKMIEYLEKTPVIAGM